MRLAVVRLAFSDNPVTEKRCSRCLRTFRLSNKISQLVQMVQSVSPQ